ncbi:LPS-assembly protein LptD [Aureimonas sp. SA4125]|uniref:LPS-assembly protein LptD n=1 Tax=Aureimonas sp. SA4125 TaxID=2826993 RepID=UPI001CC6A4D8|nr:LPS-assembly protein LptD [Aureimonas sp. SA4125]BDA84047.1 LPS-assembly protein LptD [Aureimonas sp. SA4125]
MTARGNSRRTNSRAQRSALFAGVAVCALYCGGLTASAQAPLGAIGAGVDVPSDAQLFLEADTVTYDRDAAVVTADGGVQIDYGGYKLVARKVVYNQKTKRLLAIGDVELQQPDGNKVYADGADITDDFSDGFIKAMRLETPDNTRFAATGAVREEGSLTTFEQGVYTACEACKEHPERAPLWQVKARKIVWDQKKKEVYYYGARFEIFGKPIAYFPYFQQADPTVKRKSGFLPPEFKSSDTLGYGLRVPYFFALSDSYDVTVAGTYYSRQGFLGEVEYRQATSNGYFTLQAAGISQNDPDSFNVNTPGFDNVERGMVASTGRFSLSDRWTFGWDLLAQSDRTFSTDYSIENFSAIYHTSEVYLTGLGDQSFFDLRAQRFDVQTDDEFTSENQADALPIFDYQRIDPSSIGGGEVEVNVNVASLSRSEANSAVQLLCEPDFIVNGACSATAAANAGRQSYFPYRYDFFDRSVLEGDYTRGTADATWRRTLTTDEGLLLTPSLGVRGDVYRADMSLDGFAFSPANPLLPPTGTSGANPYISLGGIDVDDSGFRGMATAGLLARYPVVIEAANSSHVIEPIAQLIVRPDEMKSGRLPNEDAQSLVFSTANLFSEDKFSGYDRIEGGTRANVGLRYAGTFETGYTLDAMVGQSYHLAGENPYDQEDLALVGYDSGLETDRSDYVTSLTLGTPIGLSLGAQGRFDEETFENRRTDVSAAYGNSRGSFGVAYSFIGAQEIYGFPLDRRQVTTSATVKLNAEWTASASLGYDLENSTLISRSFGIGYLDECFSAMATYTSTEDAYRQTDAQNTVLFKIGLRTIADTEFEYNLSEE